MKQLVDMVTNAVAAFQNSDPTTQKIVFCIFAVLLALTVMEQIPFSQ